MRCYETSMKASSGSRVLTAGIHGIHPPLRLQAASPRKRSLGPRRSFENHSCLDITMSDAQRLKDLQACFHDEVVRQGLM